MVAAKAAAGIRESLVSACGKPAICRRRCRGSPFGGFPYSPSLRAGLRHYAGGLGAFVLTIRVLIVDDHPIVRLGLRRLLDAESDIETVGEAADAERAVFEALESKPDVVVLDLMMPNKSGIEGMPALLQAVPETKVLVLSMQDDPRYVREAFDVGASGYVLKDAADLEVVGAVRAVAAGDRYVHPSLGAKLFTAEAEERRRSEQDPLSEREREVLHLLALGHTNQEIAKKLFISVRTAETHRAHIMQKLHLGSRAELVRHALTERLLDAQQDGTDTA